MKENEIQRAGISMAKEIARMDCMADDFAISDDVSNLQLFDFPTRTTDLLFGICYKGFVEFEIDLKHYTLSANHFVAIFPEQVARMVRKSDDFSAHFAIMSSKFMSSSQVNIQQQLSLFFYIKEHPCTALDKSEAAVVKEYFSLLQKKLRATGNDHQEDIIIHLVQALFYEGSDIFKKYLPAVDAEKSRKREIFEAFTKLVTRQCLTERSISYYADKLCLTPKYLSAVVKDVSGKLAGEWIDDFVIQEAKVLLKTTNLTILQISEQMNFVTQSRFGSYFKRNTGLSPKEYRQR